jgi:hypothetical protein
MFILFSNFPLFRFISFSSCSSTPQFPSCPFTSVASNLPFPAHSPLRQTMLSLHRLDAADPGARFCKEVQLRDKSRVVARVLEPATPLMRKDAARGRGHCSCKLSPRSHTFRYNYCIPFSTGRASKTSGT